MAYQPLIAQLRLGFSRRLNSSATGFAALALAALFSLGCTREEVRETYTSGKPKIMHTYRDQGKGDPIRVQTFYFNGNLESDTRFKKGLRHGSFANFWHNGQPKSNGRYRNGKEDGPWEFHFNRYVLSAKGAFAQGKKNGPWKEFWENSTVRAEGDYHKGREVGEWRYWNQQGVLKLLNSCFPANDSGTYRSFHSGGGIKEEYACRHGAPRGTFTIKGSQGNILVSGTYNERGKKEGEWEVFHPSGTDSSRQTYRGGLLHDSVFAWDRRSRLVEAGFFQEGTGETRHYDSTGALMAVKTFSKGREEGEHRYFHPNGSLKLRVAYSAGLADSLEKRWPGGGLAAKGVFRAGKKSGEWKHFDESGKLVETAHYQDGMLDGPRAFYDAKTGKLVLSRVYIKGYPAKSHVPSLPSSKNPLSAPN